MLRAKIYNIKNARGLNMYLRYENHLDLFVKNSIIKKNKNYTIIKENILHVYLVCFKNIIIIHLDEKQYIDFRYLYKKADDYSFTVYSTINYIGEKIYHVFCINMYKEWLTTVYTEWLNCNDCDYKYNILTKLYGSCIIINKRFNNVNNYQIEECKYRYVEIIGNAVINDKIKDTINKLINIVNDYYIPYSPVNYINV